MFYDIFKALCDEKGVSCNKAATKLGLSNATPTKWKKTGATPDSSTLRSIAKYFNVTTEFLLGRDDSTSPSVVLCNDCGYYYNSEDPEETASHAKRHKAWSAAVEKFGFCWQYHLREDRKAQARNKISHEQLTDDEYFELYTDVFKALFSRSLEASGYNLNHVNFETYVSMLLYQDEWKRKIPETVYQMFLDKYGTKPGISRGTYFTAKEKSPAIKPDDEAKSTNGERAAEIIDRLPPAKQEEALNYLRFLAQQDSEKK